jgi:hypothetical protein
MRATDHERRAADAQLWPARLRVLLAHVLRHVARRAAWHERDRRLGMSKHPCGFCPPPEPPRRVPEWLTNLAVAVTEAAISTLVVEATNFQSNKEAIATAQPEGEFVCPSTTTTRRSDALT